jgi:predicted lipid carrier protein YhbT
MQDAFRRDIDAIYALAERSERLEELNPSLYAMLGRNEEALGGISYAYRLAATDTGYACAFALRDGRFAELGSGARVDVTVTGREANLLAVFQRRVSPVAAIALRRIRVEGSMAALMRLASFL